MSSQIQDPIWASFPLVKFSHHTGPNGIRSYTWTHINYRNDLEFTLRDVRLVDENGNYETRAWMRVTGGVEVLESQDLSQLVKFCQEFSSPTAGEHPIDTVIKSPFLAMKYPKTTETVRRIQVKFRRESDFAQAVQMLMRLGLSVLDKDASTSTPAIKAAVLDSESSRSSACNARTAMPRSSSLGHILVQGNGRSLGISKSSSDKPHLNHTVFNSTISGDCGRAPEVNFSVSSANRSFSSNPTGSTIITNSSSYQKEPSCQPTFLSHSQAEYQNQGNAQPNIPISSLGLAELPKKSNLQLSSIQPQDNENIYHSENKLKPLELSSAYWSQIDDGNTWEPQLIDNFPAQTISGSPENEDQSLTQKNTLNDQKIKMPPRRVLPFHKHQYYDEIPTLPVEYLPPLPKPTPVAKKDLDQPVTKEISKKKATKKPIRQKSRAVRNAITAQQRDSSALPLKSDDDSSTTITAQESPNLSKKPTISAKKNIPVKKRGIQIRQTENNKRPKMISQGTQTSNVTEQNNIFGEKINIDTYVHPVDGTLASGQSPKNKSKSAENSKINCKDQGAHNNLWRTPRYDEANDETRYALIQDFICDNLENQNFLQLCKDIEFSWQRICLGR
ncbi:hypothetical protein OnM2_089030 [Erysiphe neolycopersici]|uniref:Uncharacterized protein n=1 Tax=Erysiphe neolycopersici TaxID=212602 RepID=A0A420HDH8_9PEZI|nr:hypothetical protein OnM2_089030 [Erysiphe neolycopersici]